MKSLLRVLRTSARHFSTHNGARMGAALSYYAVFSIAPLGLLVVALVGSIFGEKLVESSIITQAESLIGNGGGEFIESLINGITRQSLGVLGTILSIATIMFGTFSLLSVLDSSLDELWETKDSQAKTKYPFFVTVWRTMRKKLPAFSILPIIAILFLFFVSVSVFLSLFAEQLNGLGATVRLVEPLALLLLGTIFFALIYRILPDRRLPSRDLLIGGVVTSVLFLIGRLLIGVYIATFANTTLYGAAGSLVAILIWIYYSSQVFFFGASFTYTYSKNRRALSQ